jgi:hypothetical protein
VARRALPWDAENGLTTGDKVADYLFANYLR